MEFKTFSIRFGEYSKNPKDAVAREILLPEDILFFTRGNSDIGKGKYDGALHYLCLTKATDEELMENIQYLNTSVVRYNTNTVRFNGYALITIHDCIINTPIEAIDEDKLNELLKPEEQYFVYLADDKSIISILKINRILSESKIICTDVYLHGAIDHKEFNTIMCNAEYELNRIINPYHKITLKKVERVYGQSLLTDAIYKNLSLVYPYFSEKRIGYDFDWLKNSSKEVFGYLRKFDDHTEKWTTTIEGIDDSDIDKVSNALASISQKVNEMLGTAISMGYAPKEDMDYEEYKQILSFTKPLPLEKK